MAVLSLRSIFAQSLFVVHTWGSSWPDPWPAHWLESSSFSSEDQRQVPLQTNGDWMGSDCQVSNITAFEMAKGRQIVDFATGATEDLELPKIRPLNSTGGEQWEFDGVSQDGTGNFRLSVEFAFADRSRFYEVYYPSRSVVETCQSLGTRGMWYDEHDGYRFMFQVNSEMSEAVVTMDSNTIQGKVVIRSRAQPVTADGNLWPSENASTDPVPYWHWSEPIPGGIVDVDVNIKGKQMGWSGMGGHERFWSAFSWFTCLTNLVSVKAMLGPYILTCFSFTSNMVPGLTHQSVVLFKDGHPIFRSTLASPSETDPYAILTKTYGGAVTGTLKDKVTGFQLELVSPTAMQHYTFFVENANLGFEYILGEGVGGSGFSAISRGGHVGLAQYDGVALAEALTFPKNSPLFRSNYVE